MGPYSEIEMRIAVRVKPGVGEGELINHAVIEGGGAATRTLERPLHVSGRAPSFGLEEWSLLPEEEGGGLDMQAGSHPFQVTGSFVFHQGVDSEPPGAVQTTVKPEVYPVDNAKDIITKLPPGLVGDPTPIARCTLGQFLHFVSGTHNACPAASAVGVASVTLNVLSGVGTDTFAVPIFNMEPYAGEPARFGFFVPEGNTPVILDTEVRPNEKYAITIGSRNITQEAALLSVRTTFWGNPASPAHDQSRGWSCLYESKHDFHPGEEPPCTNPEPSRAPAFLTLPADCEEQMQLQQRNRRVEQSRRRIE